MWGEEEVFPAVSDRAEMHCGIPSRPETCLIEWAEPVQHTIWSILSLKQNLGKYASRQVRTRTHPENPPPSLAQAVVEREEATPGGGGGEGVMEEERRSSEKIHPRQKKKKKVP